MDVLENIRNNVLFLCKIQRKRIGDAERYAGKQAGYLSRIKLLDVRTLVSFAEFFSITPNDLIYKDYRNIEIDKQIEYLRSQISKLENTKNKRSVRFE